MPNDHITATSSPVVTIPGNRDSLPPVNEKNFPKFPVYKDKVIAIQGLGNIGSRTLLPFLNAGAIVIASDVNPKVVKDLKKKYKRFINERKLFIFQESKIRNESEDAVYTQKIMNPLTAWPKQMEKLGVKRVDIFFTASKGPVFNPDSIKKLRDAGVKVVSGSTNNALENIKRDARLFKEYGMLYVPDYMANGGGVTAVDAHIRNAVDAHIGNKVLTDEEIGIVHYQRLRSLMKQTKDEGENRTPQEIADEINRKKIDSWDTVKVVNIERSDEERAMWSIKDLHDPQNIQRNRENPKLLEKLELDDGTKIRVLTYRSDFPDEVMEFWDDHYAVFEIKNTQLGYTSYAAVHRLLQINSTIEEFNGEYRATGGSRMLVYKDWIEALKDALELSREMSFKNAGADLEVGGYKGAIMVHFDPHPESVAKNIENQNRKKKILISYAESIEMIGKLIGGGFLTGEDMNINGENSELMFKYAPTSIVPLAAVRGGSRPPALPTAIGAYWATTAVAEFEWGRAASPVKAVSSPVQRKIWDSPDFIEFEKRLPRRHSVDTKSWGFPTWALKSIRGLREKGYDYRVAIDNGRQGKVFLGDAQKKWEDNSPKFYATNKGVVIFKGNRIRAASSPVKAEDQVGGIDLNPTRLNLQIKRDGNGVPLPLNLQPIESMQIDGFVPVIINITPVFSMPLLSSVVNGDPIRKTTQDNDYHPSPMAYLGEKWNVRKEPMASRLDEQLFKLN